MSDISPRKLKFTHEMLQRWHSQLRKSQRGALHQADIFHICLLSNIKEAELAILRARQNMRKRNAAVRAENKARTAI